ncbi:integral membrane protein [Colletotrichum orchidophilum]|uniref:Integral membrane protein n=1 Tax=Colletotrichum orchidophilum TaxID=1209926 RepID=A0A1G4BQ76_9PEZI|nr:uncharacterized protein CORC01_00918 [Colletotrichum orchidophilum]OHF03599.1 integral membrane protein [Colletotrichum orchidophilum]
MVDVDIDPNRPRRVLAVAIFCLCLTWIAVPLRIYSRLFLTRVFTLDDKLICLVQVSFTAYLLTEIAAVLYGSGRDAVEILPEDRRIALQLFFAGEILYLITTLFLKVCVGVLLLRIAIIPLHIWTLRILLCSTLLFGSLYFFLIILQCRPIHVFWDVGPRTPGSCFDTGVVLGSTYTLAILNCLADWTFGLLPLLIVWSLHMRLKTKLLTILLLGFASIASIATIIRAVTIPGLLSQENFLRDTAYLSIWSNIEPGIGITAACAPALSPLVRHILGKRQRQAYERGIWRTRELATITNNTMTRPERSGRPHEFRSDDSSKDVLRLRFDDFSYESRISGPQAPTRTAPPPRSRASWAYPLRRGSGAGPAIRTADATLATSTVSSGGAAAEPPSSGIMKTMEFQLSYEARMWTRRGRMIPRDESMTLRPSTIAEMRRVTSGEVPLLHGGRSPTLQEYDVEVGYTRSSFRHSSPPASPWEWVGDCQSRPVSMNGAKFTPEGTRTTTAEER